MAEFQYKKRIDDNEGVQYTLQAEKRYQQQIAAKQEKKTRSLFSFFKPVPKEVTDLKSSLSSSINSEQVKSHSESELRSPSNLPGKKGR